MHEVQRAPALLNEVHRLIEDRGHRFALLGSSARKLRAAGTNLLAGRATRKKMFPLTPAELGADFDLEQALRFGTLPLVIASEDPGRTLRDYVSLYLREEIRAEAAVRSLGGFIRFLRPAFQAVPALLAPAAVRGSAASGRGCRPEVGVPSRPRASSRLAMRSFAALSPGSLRLRIPWKRLSLSGPPERLSPQIPCVPPSP